MSIEVKLSFFSIFNHFQGIVKSYENILHYINTDSIHDTYVVLV